MNRFNIGRRIEKYREKMKLSTQQLAVRIKRSQATISRIENGKQGLTPELLTQIAQELRVHPFALLSDEPLRQSLLIPVPKDDAGRYVPTLLGIAIHSARVKAKYHIANAADLLDISRSELEMLELGLTKPEEALLEKISRLFGMNMDELRLLAKMNAEFPDLCRKIAHMQQLLARVDSVYRKIEPGGEAEALRAIGDILNNGEDNSSYQYKELGDDDEALNKISDRFTKLIHNKEFYEKFVDLVDKHQAAVSS